MENENKSSEETEAIAKINVAPEKAAPSNSSNDSKQEATESKKHEGKRAEDTNSVGKFNETTATPNPPKTSKEEKTDDMAFEGLERQTKKNATHNSLSHPKSPPDDKLFEQLENTIAYLITFCVGYLQTIRATVTPGWWKQRTFPESQYTLRVLKPMTFMLASALAVVTRYKFFDKSRDIPFQHMTLNGEFSEVVNQFDEQSALFLLIPIYLVTIVFGKIASLWLATILKTRPAHIQPDIYYSTGLFCVNIVVLSVLPLPMLPFIRLFQTITLWDYVLNIISWLIVGIAILSPGVFLSLGLERSRSNARIKPRLFLLCNCALYQVVLIVMLSIGYACLSDFVERGSKKSYLECFVSEVKTSTDLHSVDFSCVFKNNSDEFLYLSKTDAAANFESTNRSSDFPQLPAKFCYGNATISNDDFLPFVILAPKSTQQVAFHVTFNDLEIEKFSTNEHLTSMFLSQMIDGEKGLRQNAELETVDVTEIITNR